MNGEGETLSCAGTSIKQANVTGGGFGVVIYSFSSKNMNGAQSIVYLDHNRPLNQGYSKSQVGKRSNELGFGANIEFRSQGNQIVSFDRCSKGQEWVRPGEHLVRRDKDQRFFFSNKCTDDNADILVRVMGCVSNEEVRRFYCYSFNSVDAFHVRYGELLKVVPNVMYDLFVSINLDTRGYSPEMDSTLCQPTFSLSFNRWQRALKCKFDKIRAAPWHNFPVPRTANTFPRYTIRANNPPPILMSLNGVLISDNEVHCPSFSDYRCVLALIMEHDVTLRVGCVLHFNMFFSFHNNFYVIYEYWHKNGKNQRFGIENPMQTRLKDHGYEFLAYVNRIRFNNFFASASLPMISDSKNLLHGYFPLGEEGITLPEDEQVQGCGIPVWVKYLQEKANPKNPMRFDVVAIAEKSFEKSFTSKGFLMNRRGTVYCPNIANFPFVWINPNVEVGTFFSFRARFNEAKNRYEIQKVEKVIKECLFDTVKLANEEDEFAFQIPLSTNFHYSTYLVVDFSSVGFVEGPWDIAAFLRELNRSVPVWCRENGDLDGRVTPLVCMSIEQPTGERFRGKSYEVVEFDQDDQSK
uniref:p-granule-associated protein DEPS-1 third OB-fold domain-containing protein n=1 Tax=Globodera rostochiensis TaxID=31243 RepID=A0A914ICE8_GLORO